MWFFLLECNKNVCLYLKIQSLVLCLFNNGGRLVREIRCFLIIYRMKRISREKKFLLGIVLFLVIVVRIFQICRQIMVICKMNLIMLCGGSRNMFLIFLYIVGFFGKGLVFFRYGCIVCLRVVILEFFVFDIVGFFFI